MIIIKNENLLNAKEDILVHQVNIDGIMGSGVAKQIAEKYPIAKKSYVEFCDEHNFVYGNLRGKVCIVLDNGKYIANIFSQDRNFDTDYEAMEMALKSVRELVDEYDLTVAMPFKIGCGIAHGEWELVLETIKKVFKGSKVVLYKLEDKKYV